ncbi:50S ribosomal protein L11 methyltransferase [Desulfovibrio aminophilus]|uniref:50S ribosomal protein L11 methyltransferase n=1 Tax=Desulfovibrio aminophilus TaxID=81425 RepID=UPI00041765CB|nr:50S ribosomal protein L11 methyltransferase [Desulfovibrio aminophilus]
MTDLLQIRFSLPAHEVDACQAFLAENVPHGWQEDQDGPDGTAFSLYVEDSPAGRAVAEVVSSRWPQAGVQVQGREKEDWGRAWMEFFVPLECGQRFEILPPWLADKANPELTPVIIEPKMAFGTGHHPTTALCLEGLSTILGDGASWEDKHFLDLGTGSGILAIALCRLGMTGVGLDIDPLAVECAEENAARNGVGDRLSLAVGSIDAVEPGVRFDLIVANILSGPLIGMAPLIVSRLAPGGALVLSGILEEQADAVAAAYEAQGLGPAERKISGEWAALTYAGACR